MILRSDQHMNSEQISHLKTLINVLLSRLGGKVTISKTEWKTARGKDFYVDQNLKTERRTIKQG